MPRDQFPVTPAVLKWARERAGLGIAELEGTFRNYAAWEVEGEVGPTYPQLETLADKLKVPIAVFFFPSPPSTPPIEETFRTLPDAVLEHLPSRIRLLMRKAKALQLNLAELCNGRNPSKNLITRNRAYDVATPVERMAREVREYLDVSIEQQITWASDDKALNNWRDRLQNAGIFVF